MLQRSGLALIDDLIVAAGSASGTSPRAVIRLSGPRAASITTSWFSGTSPPRPGHWAVGFLHFPSFSEPIPALTAVWDSGKSYTGQEMAEWHLTGSPAIVDLAIDAVRSQGGRLAEPGEFTRRAFLSGRIDLPRAEALIGLADATSPADLRQALDQHAGGLSVPLERLRDGLVDLLADLEAGLDFADEDIEILPLDQLLRRLAELLAHGSLAGRKLESRSDSSRRMRVALVGRPNAGKTSLFNALTSSEGLVSDFPGTTRDWLVAPLPLPGGVVIDLVDTAGLGQTSDLLADDVRRQTLSLLSQVDLLVICQQAGQPRFSLEKGLEGLPRLEVITKADLATSSMEDLPACSVRSGEGMEKLPVLMASKVSEVSGRRGSLHMVRSKALLETVVSRLRAAHSAALNEDGQEIVALELRHALDAMGEIAGTLTSDDLLGKIFSRFCIGK